MFTLNHLLSYTVLFFVSNLIKTMYGTQDASIAWQKLWVNIFATMALHRSVRVINDELMEIEADQKHVLRLLEDLGLIQGNVVKTARVKLSATESNVIENCSIVEGEQATLFRSGTMRCAYLAQDRSDISEVIKCLARGMSKPRTGHMMQLKRVARYLKKEGQRRHKSKPH